MHIVHHCSLSGRCDRLLLGYHHNTKPLQERLVMYAILNLPRHDAPSAGHTYQCNAEMNPQ